MKISKQKEWFSRQQYKRGKKIKKIKLDISLLKAYITINATIYKRI